MTKKEKFYVENADRELRHALHVLRANIGDCGVSRGNVAVAVRALERALASFDKLGKIKNGEG